MRTTTLTTALAALALTTSLLPAQSWSQRNPASNPGPRRAGAMAFDVAANRMIMHGGTIATPGQIVADTWSWNGSVWTLLAPAMASPPRWGHKLVRDTGNSQLITFGGRSPSINGLANDTWAWNGNTWSALTPTMAPSPRFRYGMVYDISRSMVVLFGGRTSANNSDETWEFDGANWSQVTTLSSPSPREDMVMVYDTATGTTVIFGGYDNDTATLLGDTWEYRGSDWLQVNPTLSPTARYRCAAGYDSTRQRIVAYGGHDGTAFQTDTYEYTGETWQQVGVGAGPTNSTETYYGFDPSRNFLVTYGGVGTVFSDETWEFSGTTNAIFGSFGLGCAHSAGISSISGTAPVLGQNFDMQVENVPAATLATIIAQGFSATVSNIGPLPFDLAPFGLAGCFLEVADTGIMAVLPDINGNFTFGFAVPNTPSLINLNYYVQAFIPDNLGPNSLGGMSRPSRGTFGN